MGGYMFMGEPKELLPWIQSESKTLWQKEVTTDHQGGRRLHTQVIILKQIQSSAKWRSGLRFRTATVTASLATTVHTNQDGVRALRPNRTRQMLCILADWQQHTSFLQRILSAKRKRVIIMYSFAFSIKAYAVYEPMEAVSSYKQRPPQIA